MKPNPSAPLEARFRYRIGDDEVGIDSVSGNPLQLLGFDLQTFLAGTVDLRARVHADDADITAQMFEPHPTNGRQVVNLRLRQANGRIRCFRCGYEKTGTATGITLDLLLEDAKSLPRTLDDAVAMANFRAMMENTDDYIYFKDRNHVFTGASQTLVELCEPAEHWTDLIGQTDYDVFPEAYADIYYKLEKQVFAGVEVAHEIQEYLSNEGRKGWVDNRKYPIRNAAGEIVGLYGIARDITGQRKLESDLVAIADFVAQDHGNRFLDALTEFAVRLFAVDYVHVALLEPEGTSVRVVAGRVDGKPVEPGYVYALTGTPCENVLRLDHRCYSDHVQALFPDDHDLQDLNAEAYIGEPITDGNGHAIGLIVMVSRQPMADTPATVAGLRILAEQASTGLQRQRSEARLRKQRETLQLILDFAPIGIWLQDGKGKLGFVNKAFCQATGIPEERFLGVEHYVELIPDEFRPQCLASDAKALASSGVSVTYQRLPFADGQIHDLQVIKALKRNEAGEPEALIGLSLDVTEQLRQEKRLKASEQRLNEAQSIAKVGHWELDIPTGKLHWSDEIYRIFEIEKARFGASYESFLATIHPEDREAVNAAFARSLESHLPYGITHRLLMPDGRIKYVREQGETSFKENGQPLYSLGTVQDITELTRVEQELLQERDSTRNILATVEAMIVALDTEGRITLINRKGCQILGYGEDELIGQDWFATCLPRSVDVDQVREVFQMALAGNLSGSEYYENPVRTRSGEERLIAWHNSTIRDKDGNIIGGMSAGEDITERKKNDVKLRESEQLLHAVIDEIPDPVLLKDRNGNFLLCNRAVARLYNTTPEAMVGKHDGDFGVPQEMADTFRDNVMAIMAKGETEIVFEDSRDAESGEIRHYRSIKRPFKDALGQDQILVVAQDITDIIDAQAKVVISEKRLQEVLAITNEGVWDWHIPSGKVIHNRQWFTLFGAEPGEIDETLEGFVKLIHPDDRETVLKLITAMLEGSSADYHSKHRLLTLEGRPIWVLDRGRVVERDKNGQAVRVIGSVTDVTYQVEYQQQLEHIAHYDTLSGLPNRVLLADRLHQAMAQALRRGGKLAVAYLDLDGFKAINDQYGHDVGDLLLTALAGHMKRALREGDTLARMGGDEFVAVLLDLPDVESSVPLLSRLLEAAAEVVIEQGHPMRVSASLGVTFFPQTEAIDADQLLRQADQAMYQAKLAGKNRYHIFDADHAHPTCKDHQWTGL